MGKIIIEKARPDPNCMHLHIKSAQSGKIIAVVSLKDLEDAVIRRDDDILVKFLKLLVKNISPTQRKIEKMKEVIEVIDFDEEVID